MFRAARPATQSGVASSAAHQQRIGPVLGGIFAALLLIAAVAAFVIYNDEARRSMMSMIDSATPASLSERTTPLAPPSELPRTR